MTAAAHRSPANSIDPDPSSLPDRAKAREAPNDRRPLAEIVREGKFAF